MQNSLIFFLLIVSFNCNSQNINDTLKLSDLEDRYEYLENLSDSANISWIKNQNEISSQNLNRINNRNRLINLQENFGGTSGDKIIDVTITQEKSFFYLKRKTNEDYYKIYYRKNIESDDEVLFDPKVINENYYVNYYKPSWDFSKIVIGLAEKGKEVSEIRFYNIKDKKLSNDILYNAVPSYGGIYWLQDNSGVTYLQITNPEAKDIFINTEVMIYRFNDEPKVLFSKNKNSSLEFKPEDIPVVMINGEEDKLILAAKAGASIYHDYYYVESKTFNDSTNSWKPLFKKEDKVMSYDQTGDYMIFLTSKNASNFKICKVDLKNPDLDKSSVLVDEIPNEVIKSFKITNKGIVFTTVKNGVEAKLFIRKNNGQISQIETPIPAGKIKLKSLGKDSDYLEVTIEGWLNTSKRFVYNFNTEMFAEANLVSKEIDTFVNDLRVEEIEITAHDGAKVPLSLIYNKNIVKNRDNRVFMVAYGSYGATISPTFSDKVMTWVHEGGIYAIAHVRGGGAKGDMWYKGGYKETKPNTWKDLIACTEYLIEEKYTASNKVAINGASAGAIAIGRAMTERPDLFAASIINVGFLNTIKLETDSNGANNTKEFGTIKNQDEFKWLLEMDSFHHLEENIKYPGTLLTAGLNDKRVPAWDSLKFYAKLKNYNSSDNPILLKVDFGTGHGNANSKNKRILNNTDVLAFALWQTGHPDYQIINN
ncbi:prolyl oligopeptidase family serine peptidase [Aquimarina brevivitae]|uniref:prolyl oligopeptidase n=1 Tax=Aquimarina brevivitae TaxID=323412 RepID=A0A4Q7PG83_9FLAO|nr:prolyl oligopeptidase family serine peptidase [Aquimarina brevivitae]RZS99157.1 prolyl oligopeptidase [Aquimarina brevivitae]